MQFVGEELGGEEDGGGRDDPGVGEGFEAGWEDDPVQAGHEAEGADGGVEVEPGREAEGDDDGGEGGVGDAEPVHGRRVSRHADARVGA